MDRSARAGGGVMPNESSAGSLSGFPVQDWLAGSICDRWCILELETLYIDRGCGLALWSWNAAFDGWHAIIIGKTGRFWFFLCRGDIIEVSMFAFCM